MLLLHGIGGELCVWEPLLSGLTSSFDVVAVDLPGFGRSPALAADITPTPSALARAVSELMGRLGLDRAHLVGNSLGGWVALELAAAGRACSVCALCPAGLWSAPVLTREAVVRGRAHRFVRRVGPVLALALTSRGVRRAVLGPFVAHPDRVPYQAAVRMVRSYGRATAYEATAIAMRQSHFQGSEQIEVPVTLAFGERDRLIAPARPRIRNARTVRLPGCGHIPMWDDPALVLDLIRQTAARGAATRPPARGIEAGR